MSRRARQHPRSPSVVDQSGMVVLAPLIVLTVLLVMIVVAGKLLYRPPPVYVKSLSPTKHVAASSGVVYSAGREIRSIDIGDTVWVIWAGNGLPVLFADSLGTRVIGVGHVFLSPVGGR